MNSFLFSQTIKKDSLKTFNYNSLIIPTALINYGVIGIESDQIKDFNFEIKEEINEHIDEKITIDDFSQYAPAAAVYALNYLTFDSAYCDSGHI